MSQDSEPSWWALATTAGVGLIGLGAAMYRFSGGKAIEPYVPWDNQSVEVGSEELDRVNGLVKNNELQSQLYPDVSTLYEGIRRGMRVTNNGQYLGRRVKQEDGTEPYVWQSYGEVIESADCLGAAFIFKGIAAGQNTMIGIYSINRPEWIITEHACFNYNMITVPLYDTLGPESSMFIINQGEIKMVICDTVKKAESLLTQHELNNSTLRTLVIMEAIEPEFVQRAARARIEVLGFEDLMTIGKDMKASKPHKPPTPGDIATICYTSGTTGTPKGVVLTHGNIIAVASIANTFSHDPLSKDDVLVSYLPLAHMFERAMHAVVTQIGASIGFFRGDVRTLMLDLQELKPTLFPTVPRLLNRMYDKVMSEVNKSYVKKTLFQYALSCKQSELDRHIHRNNSIWDKIVFKKIQQGLGGRVRFICTGSAPCDPNVLNFIRCTSGALVVEGYGQTETAAIATVSIMGDSEPGHVGPPIPCTRIKMVDVPEMNYFAKDGCGEVCMKGPSVFVGYYKEPEKTAEALDADGWLHSGDIGRWTPEGKIQLVDRKKHIFKLSHGEYIAPEKIEGVYTNCKFVAQVFVYGESLKSALIAVVVPDAEVLLPHCKKEGIPGDMTELCQSEDIKKLILDDMIASGKSAKLASFEQVKNIHLYPELFTVDNGLLTPTFKSKRPSLQEFFKPQLADMYKNID